MSDELIPERAPAFQLPVPADGLERLVGKAKAYAKGAKAGNTRTAYGADWRDYAAWCLRHGVPALPPSAQAIGLYITDLAGQGRAVSTIERRLSGICWHFRQNKQPIDRSDPHIREVLAGIRNKHSRVPTQKAAVAATDVIAMTGVLDTGLVGIRDRAILLVGFAGGLRRSEIVGLDHGAGDTDEGLGWPEFLPGGVVLRIRGKGNRWREVEIGRGSSARTCPVACLKEWIAIARIVHGPVFRRIAAKRVQTERLSDRYVARLVQRTALAAGVRGDLAEGERREAFAGHSLRAGLASSAEVDERYVQRQLGHATVTMTRRYQRERGRFRVNLTKVAGL